MTLGGPAPLVYPVPSGIPTSVTLHELALLQRLAQEAGTVLEIGTHYGFSCIGMALAGAHVTSVDPHYEGPANAPDTWEPFLRNVQRHGLKFAIVGADSTPPTWFRPPTKPVINAARSPIDEFDPDGLSWQTYGLVFIDGDHVWPQPWRDAETAMQYLRANPDPGYIAFHDVTPNWPGVYRAALQLEEKGWAEVGRVQTLRVYRRP